MATKSKAYKVWGMPILLGVIIMVGLILAIMGTGVWHILSWLVLCVPVYIMIKYGAKALK